MKKLLILAATFALAGVQLAYASGSHGTGAKTEGGEAATTGGGTGMMGAGGPMRSGPMILMPLMSSENGRRVFAEKGCVVCHSVNGIGGKDAPPLEASEMPLPMNPFEFAARMWRGAEAMIILQQDELGEQIEITGQELADLIAFMHDPNEQKKFSEEDIPERIEKLLHGGD